MSTTLFLDNLLAAGLQMAALGLAAAAAPALFRLRAPKARLLLWQAALAACLVLPWAAPWRTAAAEGTVSVTGRLVGAATVGSAAAWPWREWTVGLLAAGAIVRLLLLAGRALRLRRLWREATPLGELPDEVGLAQRLTGARAEVAVSSVSGPATFGVRRPRILLPAWFFALPRGAREAIVCHELLHVRRRDWLWLVAEETAQAVFWFHPAVWWLAGQIQLAREQAVDEEAVARLEGRDEYLDALVRLAASQAGLSLEAAPLFLRRRHLARRVEFLLKERPMSKFRTILSLAAAATLTAGVAVVAVSTFPLVNPAPAQEKKAEPQRMGGNEADLHLKKRVMPKYPPEAKEQKISGLVRLEVIIDRAGMVRSVEVLSGHELLVPAAVEAVRQWEYEPILKDGEPVEVIAKVDVNFQLKD